MARAISSFVENPFTKLVNGVLLLMIGLSEASRTVREDIANGRLRAGHGLILIGLFGVLQSLPHLLEGLGAGARYVEFRDEEIRDRRADVG